MGGDGPNRKFKYWFNSSEASEATQDRSKHMGGIERQVRDLQQNSSNRLEAFFLGKDDFFDLHA